MLEIKAGISEATHTKPGVDMHPIAEKPPGDLNQRWARILTYEGKRCYLRENVVINNRIVKVILIYKPAITKTQKLGYTEAFGKRIQLSM